ncbi:transposase [Pseudomonas sp. TCU-HL1]|nr:transposase [Pseudomonas sp. TCU-HL1]
MALALNLSEGPEAVGTPRFIWLPQMIQRPVHLLIDRAYEGNETRQLALDLGFIPVVPPLKTCIDPWAYDREIYKRRNEVERLFRRLKGFRRFFSRFEKLDVMFIGFVNFAPIVDGLKLC